MRFLVNLINGLLKIKTELESYSHHASSSHNKNQQTQTKSKERMKTTVQTILRRSLCQVARPTWWKISTRVRLSCLTRKLKMRCWPLTFQEIFVRVAARSTVLLTVEEEECNKKKFLN